MLTAGTVCRTLLTLTVALVLPSAQGGRAVVPVAGITNSSRKRGLEEVRGLQKATRLVS